MEYQINFYNDNLQDNEIEKIYNYLILLNCQNITISNELENNEIFL